MGLVERYLSPHYGQMLRCSFTRRIPNPQLLLQPPLLDSGSSWGQSCMQTRYKTNYIIPPQIGLIYFSIGFVHFESLINWCSLDVFKMTSISSFSRKECWRWRHLCPSEFLGGWWSSGARESRPVRSHLECPERPGSATSDASKPQNVPNKSKIGGLIELFPVISKND